MKYDVFISYSRDDIQEVTALKKHLETKLPQLKSWFDIDGIESGEEFEDKIITAIDNSLSVLFFISDNSLTSKWTKDEVVYAKNSNKKIVPILLKGASLKGWFLFKFGRVDCIDSTDELQRQKLIKNLATWTGYKQAAEQMQENLPEEIVIGNGESAPAPKPISYVLLNPSDNKTCSSAPNKRWGVIAASLMLIIGCVWYFMSDKEPIIGNLPIEEKDSASIQTDTLTKVAEEIKDTPIINIVIQEEKKNAKVVENVKSNNVLTKAETKEAKLVSQIKQTQPAVSVNSNVSVKNEIKLETISTNEPKTTSVSNIDSSKGTVMGKKTQHTEQETNLILIKGENGKYGFSDKTGKEVIRCIYDYAMNFSEGLAVVWKDGKCGFIDKTGKEVIPCIYDGAGSFSEGLAIVKKKNIQWHYINKNGEKVK